MSFRANSRGLAKIRCLSENTCVSANTNVSWHKLTYFRTKLIDVQAQEGVEVYLSIDQGPYVKCPTSFSFTARPQTPPSCAAEAKEFVAEVQDVPKVSDA